MNTSSGFFFFGVCFSWLCGLFADDIGKRMHDERFRFFYWAGSEMKLQRLDYASEVFQLFGLLRKLGSSMHRGNYNSLHELLVQSLIDYHLSVRGLCFSFGDHAFLLGIIDGFSCSWQLQYGAKLLAGYFFKKTGRRRKKKNRKK